jgi:AcrR family transcriptional regulator
MSSTKKKIIHTAIRLYNERGVCNVTMRDIAAEVGISPGNLAYHYKNQDYIIEEIFRCLKQERDQILVSVQQIPTFDNINQQILPLLEVAKKYMFFHIDTVHLLRTYPKIASLQQAYYEDSIKYDKAVIDHFVEVGIFRAEQRPGQYHRLAHTAWMLMTFWLQQLTVRGYEELNIEELRQSLWDLVLPHLTEKGSRQFRNMHNQPERIQK